MSTLTTSTSSNRASLNNASGNLYFETDTNKLIIADQGGVFREYHSEGSQYISEGGTASADFDGTGHITLGEMSEFAVNPDLTFAAWVRPHSDSFTSNYGVIFSGGSYTYDRFVLRFESATQMRATVGPALIDFEVPQVSADTWIHVCITHTNGLNVVYLNGLAVTTFSAANAGSANYTNAFVIGKNADTPAYGDSKNFKGRMDDVLIFNRALAPLSIIRLYQYGLFESPLVYLKLDNSASDTFGNYNGTISTTGVTFNTTNARS